MKRAVLASLALAALAGWITLIPAHAAPPTATPSPGYDARLQEQRAASRTYFQPAAPFARPVSRRHRKKPHAH